MKTALLGEVASFVNGGTPARSVPEFYEGSIPWITGADVASDQTISARSHITEEAVARSAAQILAPGSLALVTRTSVGKVGLVVEPTAISQDITGVIPATDIATRFLMHVLRWNGPGLARRARGATIKGVTRAEVASISVPVLTLDEQRRIAAILDQADAIRAKRRQVLAHLDTLARSTFVAMFGGLDATATVADVASNIRTGPFGSQLLHSEFVDEGVAVLGLDNVVGNQFVWGQRRYITPEKYEKLRRYTVTPGDVLISIMGTTGRCVVVPDGIPTAINTKHICAITPTPGLIDPSFLRAAFLWHPKSRAHLLRQTKGSIMDGLNMGIIKAMPVPVPPIELQREFAAKVEAVDAQRAVVERALDADDELFASLQTRALRGEQ